MNDPLGGLGAPEEPRPLPRPVERQELPPRAPPISTIVLLALLAVPFAAELYLDQWRGDDPSMLFRLGALFAPALADGDWWRVGSYAFLHIGPVHALMNGWALWVLMRDVEWSYGSAAAIGIFAASALAGGAVSAAWRLSTESPQLVAGASGGIFGLFGATGALLFRLRDRVPPEARKALFRGFVLNLLINVAIALYVPVDSFAHAGGFACGALLGLVAPLPISARRPWHLPVQLFLLSAALLLAASEGAAVARAARPRPRLLKAHDVEAQVPWMLVPLSEGVAAAPAGMGLRAAIGHWRAPAQGQPREVQIGDRKWHLTQERHEDQRCGEETTLVSDDEDPLGVRMCCSADWCQEQAGERLAEQIASTLHSLR